MFLNRLFSTLVLLAFLFSACTKTENNQGDSTEADSTLGMELEAGDTANVNAHSEESVDLYLKIPTPIEVADSLKMSGATYNQTLLNPENKVGKYQTQAEQAVGIGIYSGDLAYANAFNRKQEALKYFASVRKVSESLGLESVFNKNLQNRLSANENSQDSLDKIFSDVYNELETKLNGSGREVYFALMVSGGWVESMFLATEVWKASKKESIAKMITGQAKSLESLLTMIAKFEKDPGFAKIYPELKALKAGFTPEKEGATLTEKQLNDLTAKLKTLRTELAK